MTHELSGCHAERFFRHAEQSEASLRDQRRLKDLSDTPHRLLTGD
jgi:hypothetical protein